MHPKSRVTTDVLILSILVWSLGVFGTIGTLMPFIRYDDWWIRDFDYPRVQLSIILGAAIVINALQLSFQSAGNVYLLIACLLALTYQLLRIVPYTPIWKNQTRGVERKEALSAGRDVKLLMSNVLQENKATDKLIELVGRKDPDILITLETNTRWEKDLDKALSDKYSHTIKIPQENRYGMHLYCKWPLRKQRVNYLIDEEVPSIYTQFKLPAGGWINLYVLHPTPPSPTEKQASTARDAELALVGKTIKERGNAQTIVAGDLNDVAWSNSTRLFQRISGLLDPRRGRGFFATYHADYWFARWPLDHVFHSADFGLVDIARLPHIGSDHYPIYVELAYQPSIKKDHIVFEENDGDSEEAKKSIEMGKKGVDDLMFF